MMKKNRFLLILLGFLFFIPAFADESVKQNDFNLSLLHGVWSLTAIGTEASEDIENAELSELLAEEVVTEFVE